MKFFLSIEREGISGFIRVKCLISFIISSFGFCELGFNFFFSVADSVFLVLLGVSSDIELGRSVLEI